VPYYGRVVTRGATIGTARSRRQRRLPPPRCLAEARERVFDAPSASAAGTIAAPRCGARTNLFELDATPDLEICQPHRQS
jgi:hypothetical protein